MIWGLKASDNLNQFHNRDRVHEMHTNNLIRSLGWASQLCDRNWWCVWCNNSFWFKDLVQWWKNRLFDVCIFYNCLNNEVNILISESVDVMDEVDSAIECCNLFVGDFILWKFFLKPWVDELLRFFQCNLVWIINCDIQSCNSVGNNGNTSTHLTRTNDTKWLKVWVMIEEEFFY